MPAERTHQVLGIPGSTTPASSTLCRRGFDHTRVAHSRGPAVHTLQAFTKFLKANAKKKFTLPKKGKKGKKEEAAGEKKGGRGGWIA